MKESNLKVLLLLVLLLAPFLTVATETCQAQQETQLNDDKARLVKAVMAESIEGLSPVNEAVVFSIDLRRLICFTEFDPVPVPSLIYHTWYHRGVLIAQKQLTIKPPRWSSFSSMQLRDTDIGPWQVDVTDDHGRVIEILRFSITE